MKAIFKYTFMGLLAGAMLMTSCSEDRLTTVPTQSMSGQGLLANGKSALVTLNGIYREMYTSGWSTTGNTHQCFGISAYTLCADVMGEDHVMAAQGSGWFWFDALYNVNGKRAYSTYVELNIPFYMGGLDWDLTGGVTPFESAGKPVNTDDGIVREYFYAKGFACVKASLRATKNFELGDIKMPIFAEIHTNPYMQKAWLVVGVRVLPFK